MRLHPKLTLVVLFLFLLISNAAMSEEKQKLKLIKTEGEFSYYEGSIIVSGVFHEQVGVGDGGKNFEKGLVCFSVVGSTEKLIPREQDPRDAWFCFSNTGNARALFRISGNTPKDACFVLGKATVQISKYVVNRTASEVHDTAILDRVIYSEKPIFRKECSVLP